MMARCGGVGEGVRGQVSAPRLGHARSDSV